MGTNASYGGSTGKDWTAVRQQWTGLGGADLPASDGKPQDDTAPGDVPVPPDFQPSPGLEALGQALADALGRGLPRNPNSDVPLTSLLPRRRGGDGGGGGGGAGAAGGGSSGNAGRGSGRTRQQIPQQAARGGAAIGAAIAYRDRDAAALGDYGVTLAELDAMGPRQRNNAILDLVLGDAGHPDEAAVRAAALEQVKVLTSGQATDRTAAEAVRAFIGQLVVQVGLVELKDQILAKTTSRSEAKRRETSLRQWVASKVRTLDLAKYGSVTSRDCHKVASRMASDALKLMRKMN